MESIIAIVVAGILCAWLVVWVVGETLRGRDRRIAALEVRDAQSQEHIRRADLETLTIRKSADEWRAQAIAQSRRVHELTDRLLAKENVPTARDDSIDPPSVADADRMAMEEAAIRDAHMEPVLVNDDEVPPVNRLAPADPEDADYYEGDTSFVSRMGDD